MPGVNYILSVKQDREDMRTAVVEGVWGKESKGILQDFSSYR